MKERKDRVDDALHATRAAVEEGIVPGGGVALLRCRKAVAKAMAELTLDEVTGARIVYRALEEPLRQIASNAGVEGANVVERVKQREGAYGYNAETGEYEHLIGAGIIDPTKVVRVALQNAASVAGLLLTTEVIITEVPERTNAPASPDMGEDMY